MLPPSNVSSPFHQPPSTAAPLQSPLPPLPPSMTSHKRSSDTMPPPSKATRRKRPSTKSADSALDHSSDTSGTFFNVDATNLVSPVAPSVNCPNPQNPSNQGRGRGRKTPAGTTQIKASKSKISDSTETSTFLSPQESSVSSFGSSESSSSHARRFSAPDIMLESPCSETTFPDPQSHDNFRKLSSCSNPSAASVHTDWQQRDPNLTDSSDSNHLKLLNVGYSTTEKWADPSPQPTGPVMVVFNKDWDTASTHSRIAPAVEASLIVYSSHIGEQDSLAIPDGNHDSTISLPATVAS